MAKHAAEIIAFHLGWDIGEVREYQYQSTRYVSPAVFAINDHYYCSPTDRQMLPKGWGWEKIATYYGRDVWRAGTETT